MASKTQAVPLSLDQQEILTSLWKPLCVSQDLQFAEYSFANVYLFRKQHKYHFIPGDKHPCVRGEFNPGQYYFIPTCTPEQIKLEKMSCQKHESMCIYPVPDKWLKIFHECHPTVTSNRGDSDYLFTKEKFQTLSGRSLSSRRNQLYQLTDQHQLESRVLTASEVPAALQILESWQSHSKQSKEKSDYAQTREALELMERLGLFGRIIYVDGEPAGFTLAELITPKTALLHFAKGRYEYKGITTYLYQDFANHLPGTVEWLNLEQDLGIPSLRQAKEAYSPDCLLTKWRIDLQQHQD